MRCLFCFIASLFFLLTAKTQNRSLVSSDGLDHLETDKSGITIQTRIVIEKDEDKTKIVFIQETENGFVFKNVNWKGDVKLLLDNGEIIVLEDSRMTSSHIERGGLIGGFYVPDIYQRQAAFYLSEEECDLLKQHSIVLVSYLLDDKYDKNVHYLEINDKNQALKTQLIAVEK